MTPHSIFLRNACALPNHLAAVIETFCKGWTRLEQIESLVFDEMIRRANWHFMWVQETYSRRGIGRTEQKATQRALRRSLASVNMAFNAAEFESLRISRFVGSYIANVTIHARHIQESTSLEIAPESYLQSTR